MLASALLVHFIRYRCTVSGSRFGCLNPEAVTTCNPHCVYEAGQNVYCQEFIEQLSKTRAGVFW